MMGMGRFRPLAAVHIRHGWQGSAPNAVIRATRGKIDCHFHLGCVPANRRHSVRELIAEG